MEPLINEASKELNQKFSIESISSPTVQEFKKETQACMKRVQDTSEATAKIQFEVDNMNELLHTLKSNDLELQAAFDKIDKLEILVSKVKETYNAVAVNLDQMEKAVNASTPFRLGNRKDNTPVQPYFPPPNHVEIYDTNELFSSLSL